MEMQGMTDLPKTKPATFLNRQNAVLKDVAGGSGPAQNSYHGLTGRGMFPSRNSSKTVVR